MHRLTSTLLSGLGLLLSLSLVSCGTSPRPADAGRDASSGSDAGMDAGPAGRDAGSADAGPPEPLPACGADNPGALAACAEEERYLADLRAIEGPRAPGDVRHAEVRELCATRLSELGFEVERHDYGGGINIVGVRPGSSAPEEQVLISAHYDSVRDCAGADDNGSGVAGALEAARVLSMATFPRTLVVACWDQEEAGLVGSSAYVARAVARGDQIAANFVFEMIGYRDETPGSQRFPDGFEILFPEAQAYLEAREGRGDFIAIIADELRSEGAAASMEHMAARVGLPAIALVVDETFKLSPLTSDLRRSDHGSFWVNDLPGMMITDTANFRYDRYHCGAGPDTVDQLDHRFATQVIRTTIGAAALQLGL